MKLSGIYSIENSIDKKSYIGSSKNIRFRWYRHLKKLRGNLHENDHLQNAFNKHGENNFGFKVLKLVEKEENLKNEEQIYLNEAKKSSDLYYNINFRADRINYTPEVRQKMSNSAKKHIGEKNAFYGKKHSEETKEKIRLKRKKQVITEKTKEKLSKAAKEQWKRKKLGAL